MNFIKTLFGLLTGNPPENSLHWTMFEPHWNKELSRLQGFNTPYYQKWLDAVEERKKYLTK